MDFFPSEIRGEVFKYVTTLHDIYTTLLTSKDFYEYVHTYVTTIESNLVVHTPDLWILKFKGLRKLNENVIAHLSEGLLPPLLKIGTIVLGSDEELRDLGLKGVGWDLRLTNDEETFAVIIQGSRYIIQYTIYPGDKIVFKNLEIATLTEERLPINFIFAEYLENIFIPSLGSLEPVEGLIKEIKGMIKDMYVDMDILEPCMISHFGLLSVDPLLVEKGYQLMEKYGKVDRKEHLAHALIQHTGIKLTNIHLYRI